MIVDWKHTHASPDHFVDMKSGLKCALIVMPKTAWDFSARGCLWLRRYVVWLLAFGASLAPEQSGNLYVIFSHGCLRFQEGWNVPMLVLRVRNNLGQGVWVSGPHPSYIRLENLVSSSQDRLKISPAPCQIFFTIFWGDILHLSWGKAEESENKAYQFSMDAFFRFGFKILKPLPGE